MPRFEPGRSFTRLALLLSALLICLGGSSSPASAARIVGGNGGFCALTADRGVSCWGQNSAGRLGTPTSGYADGKARPTRIPGVTNVRSLSAAGDRVCALTFDGEILCWGSTAPEAPAGRPVASVTRVPGAVDLAMTRNHLCLQAADRSVSCASFLPGEATLGPFTPLRGATRVSAITIDGEGDSFCLLRAARSALCFTDSFGNANVSRLYRAETPQGLRAVAATRTFANTCFVDRSGRVRCTGNDPFDPMAAQGEGAPVKERDRNRYHVVPGIKDATGLSSGSALCVIRRGGRLTCVNPNDAVPQRRSGVSGAGNAHVVRGIDAVREVVNTYGTTCAIRSGGAVWCWGLGYTGHGPTFSATPVAVEGLTDATSISVGDQHSCAIRSGGDVACWGAASAGSFGARFDTTAMKVNGIAEATAVAATSRGTCALTTGAALRCWGPIGFGAMEPLKPFTVARAESATGEPVGLSGSCLRLDARIDCLELRLPRTTGRHPSTRPTGTLVTQPGLSQVAEVVDDGFVRCAIHVDRTVTCAGTGWLAPQSDRTSVAAGPTSMPGLTGVVQLSSGERGACAVIQGGRVTCWGGADPVFDSVHAVPLPAAGSPGHVIPGIEDAVAVEVDGPGGPCVVRSSGSVRCARAPVDPTIPTGASTATTGTYEGYDMPGIQDATAIRAGQGHTCVLRRSGAVACWGEGFAGQLGDGSAPAGHGPQFSPTPVAGLVSPTS